MATYGELRSGVTVITFNISARSIKQLTKSTWKKRSWIQLLLRRLPVTENTEERAIHTSSHQPFICLDTVVISGHGKEQLQAFLNAYTTHSRMVYSRSTFATFIDAVIVKKEYYTRHQNVTHINLYNNDYAVKIQPIASSEKEPTTTSSDRYWTHSSTKR